MILLRHGHTQGNLAKRYIGTTDEPLCDQGIQAIQGLQFPPVQKVYCSPMLRCIQTARLAYPHIESVPVYDFRECDFGRFENKSFQELKDDPDYMRWLESMGTLPFPGGESRDSFIIRCCSAYEALAISPDEDAAIIAHGGTLMSILSRFAVPEKDYFSWQTPCATGFLCNVLYGHSLNVQEKIGGTP